METESGPAKGGKTRAERLTPEQRKEIARAGAVAKWKNAGVEVKTLPRAMFGSADKPLVIGEIVIPCYVLEDGRRVLSQRGLQTGIGLSSGGGKGGARKLVAFMEQLERKGIDTKGLAARANNPIQFLLPHGGNPADGYEATILPDICAVIIEAGRMGVLDRRVAELPRYAAILQHGFARLGIIALVDEITGYRDYRHRQNVAEIVEKFVSKELRPWAKRFPFSFYENIFRLKGWATKDLTPNSPKPLEVGKITDDLIYKRLAPGVRTEIKKLVPRSEKGYLAHKLHQRLTDDIGNPKLEKHIAVVDALMTGYDDWDSFMRHMNKVYPPYGKNYELGLEDAKKLLAK